MAWLTFVAFVNNILKCDASDASSLGLFEVLLRDEQDHFKLGFAHPIQCECAFTDLVAAS